MMELREIEVFLVLCEELHFGRTAERLFMSQGRVSQVIKEMERHIGAPLFVRTSRSVQLTAVGRQLRDDFLPAYAGLRQSVERARLAARGITGRLRVLMMPLNVLDLHVYWTAFRRRNPGCELQVRTSTTDQPFTSLRNGDCDVFVAWLPVEEEDLTVGPVLLVDPQMLAVADHHVLADRTSVGLETLAEFPLTSVDLGLDYWEESFLPFTTPRGRKLERVYPVSTAEDILGLVTMGETVQVWPTHVARHWMMPNIRWLTLPDLSGMTFALVWKTEAENDLIRSLADTVRHIGTLEL